MSWYKTGTVAVTNGSTEVSGAGTAWVGAVQAGDALHLPDGRTYEVAAVVSADEITLSAPYQGATEAGATYSAQPTQGRVTSLITRVTNLLSTIASVKETVFQGLFQDGSAGAPGVSFDADQDSGLTRLASNRIGAVAGGILAFSWMANRVGVNISEPTATLDVNGDARFRGALLFDSSGVGFGDYLTYAAGSGLTYHEDGTPSWRMSGAQSVPSFVNSWMGFGTDQPEARVDARGAVQSRDQTPIFQLYETDQPDQKARTHIAQHLGRFEVQYRDAAGVWQVTPYYIDRNSDGGAGNHFWTAGKHPNNRELMRLIESGALGLGIIPEKKFHVYSSSNSSCRARIENGEGWADLVANDEAFHVTANATGGGDRQFLSYYGHGRLDWLGDALTNSSRLSVGTANTAFTSSVAHFYANRGPSGAYKLIDARVSHDTAPNSVFYVRGDGHVFADGAFNSGGADYAEMFEWADGNPNGEDRRGVTVVLDGAFIRPAAPDDPVAAILGVISARPSVLGDAQEEHWHGMYLLDAQGAVAQEECQILSWSAPRIEAVEEQATEGRPVLREQIEMVDGRAVVNLVTEMEETPVFDTVPLVDAAGVPVLGEDGAPRVHSLPRMVNVTRETGVDHHSYPADQIPEGLDVPADAVRTTDTRPALNPDYDPTQTYVPRSKRPEWDAVGLVGKLWVKHGQPVGERWILMEQGGDGFDRFLVR